MANSVILELFDDDRNSIKYELLDIVNYEEIEYAVMMKQYAVDGEVEIFQLKHLLFCRRRLYYF